jgi:monoamine oxidase
MHYRATVEERLAALKKLAGPSRDVTILGAGMAGLVAATELNRLGYQVRVLEATGRAGGRVHTWRPDGEHYHEFGAMRIPLAHTFTRHYIKKYTDLKLREFVTAYQDDDAWLYLRGDKFRMKEAGLHVPELFELSTADRMQIERINPNTADNARPTLSDVMMRQVVGPILKRLTPADERALLLEGPPTPLSAELEAMTFGDLASQHLRGSDAVDLLGVSTMTDVWWHICPTFFIREEMLKDVPPLGEIVGGTDLLPRRLAERLSDVIEYNVAATGIELAGGGVRLTTQRTIAAGPDASYSKIDTSAEPETHDHHLVLCTIPFGVLRGMELTGFSAEKMEAIRIMNYESSTKVLLLCSRRRWEDQGIIGGATMSDTILRSTYYPSDHYKRPVDAPRPEVPTGESLYRIQYPSPKQTGAAEADSGEAGVLVASYSWGRDARRMGAMPHDMRVDTCLSVLEKLHPGIREDVQCSASRSWDNHPWARGAFAIAEPNETLAHFDNARRPEGGVYFAGEHLSFNRGWMQGAIISALEAVETMLSNLSKPQ